MMELFVSRSGIWKPQRVVFRSLIGNLGAPKGRFCWMIGNLGTPKVRFLLDVWEFGDS